MAKGGKYLVQLKSLATTNLAILSVRLVQVFFAGCIIGIMGYYIKLNAAESKSAPSPYVFSLVVACSAVVTQFIYCFSFYHRLTFVWDAAIAVAFILSMFWMLNYVQPLSCKWGAFNPFGSDRCAQTRSVLIMQIVDCILWVLTASIGAFQLFRISKNAPRDEIITKV